MTDEEHAIALEGARKYQEQNFKVKIESCPKRHVEHCTENILVTHNGYQWSGTQVSLAELYKVRDAINAYIAIREKEKL